MTDPWRLAFDGFDPGDERRREALCSLGNGVIALRGSAPEAEPSETDHYPGTYAAGFYDRLADEVDGVRLENESLVNLPSPLPLRIGTTAGWLRSGDANHELLDHRQSLDLRRGLLCRTLRFRDRTGRVTRLDESRFVHMAVPHLAALQTIVTAENWTGELRIRSGLDGAVTNAGVARYGALDGRHLQDVWTARGDGVLLATARTTQSHGRVAVAVRTTLRDEEGALGGEAPRVLEQPGSIAEEHSLRIAVGHPVTVEKLVAIHTSRDPAISEPLEAVVDAVRNAGRFAQELGSHTRAWGTLWDLFGLDLEDAGELPDDLVRDVRLGVFHLLQTISPLSSGLDVGLPARGLAGEAYRGHVFWDEMLVMPSLAARAPSLARTLLLYRHRRLPAARRAAQALGCRGACFPWQSGSDGREESQVRHLNPVSGHWLPDDTFRQRHVGLAVALSTWRYVETTGDHEFLCEYGADLILETATFFADLAHHDVDRDRFVITGVVGPDEFHTGYPGRPGSGVDNNAYTNVMTAWLAHTAGRVLALLPERQRRDALHRHNLGACDLARWSRLARQMFVPFHDGLISQFEGYGDLEELDLDVLRARHGDIRRLDRLLEAEGRSVDAYKASKQADVLMLLYVLSVDELDEVLTRLGYGLDRASVPALVDYYLRRTCHGSTLSDVVHTWLLARAHRHTSLGFLFDVVHSDTGDVHGGTTAEGIHLAAMTGGADLLQRCYAGLTPRLDALEISPAWFRELGTLRTHLRYHGHEIDLRVDAATVRLRSDDGHAPPILVRCSGTHLLAAGDELVVPHDPSYTAQVPIGAGTEDQWS